MIPTGGNYLGSYSKSTPYMDQKIESIILEAIKNILHKKLGTSSHSSIRMMKYFLVYCHDKESSEKSISSVHIKVKSKNISFAKLQLNEIESEGVNIGEFIDYITVNGAKEIKSSKISFNEV